MDEQEDDGLICSECGFDHSPWWLCLNCGRCIRLHCEDQGDGWLQCKHCGAILRSEDVIGPGSEVIPDWCEQHPAYVERTFDESRGTEAEGDFPLDQGAAP